MITTSRLGQAALTALSIAAILLTPALPAQGDLLPGCDYFSDGSNIGKDEYGNDIRHCYTKIFVYGEDESGNEYGIPCATLWRPRNRSLTYHTDDNGVAAFFEPGLMGRPIGFEVRAPGYDTKVDDLWTDEDDVWTYEGGEVSIKLELSDVEPPACEIDHVEDSNLVQGYVPLPEEFFQIRVVDRQGTCAEEDSGDERCETELCGVPLAELREVEDPDPEQDVDPTIPQPRSLRRYHTDSSGNVAFYDWDLWQVQNLPECTDGAVTLFFDVSSHGFHSLKNQRVEVCKGGSAMLYLDRRQVAERLHRVTGAGIHRDSVLMGCPVPIPKPVLNGEVLGQDTVMTTVYDGRVFWAWGDTTLPNQYRVHATAATSALDVLPDRGVDLEYIVGSGLAAKNIAPMPEPGLTWILSLATVPRANPPGGEWLFAFYQKISDGGDWGIARFNDAGRVFDNKLSLKISDTLLRPLGHTYKWRHRNEEQADTDDPEYLEYIYFQNAVRVRATEEHLLATQGDPPDLEHYEAFTPLVPDGQGGLQLNRVDGVLHYDWHESTPTIRSQPDLAVGLTGAERLNAHMRLPDLGFREWGRQDAAPYAPVGSTAWSDYRKRFIRIMLGFYGETWYSEADTPLGPWAYTRRLSNHQNVPYQIAPYHQLYNPRHHPFFDHESWIYFEGTYANWDWRLGDSHENDRPGYEYNQIMYKADLDDDRLTLPVPVYDLAGPGRPGEFTTKHGLRPDTPDSAAPFMAMERPRPLLRSADVLRREDGLAYFPMDDGSILWLDPEWIPATTPVYWSGARCGAPQLVVGGDPTTPPLFHALPPDTPIPLRATNGDDLYVPLYEHVHEETGERAYSIQESLEGYAPNGVIAQVWRNEISVVLPVSDYLAPVIAEAGPDQCLRLARGESEVAVTLEGSAVGEAASDPGSFDYRWYRWEEPLGSELSTKRQPTLALGEGLHPLVLEVRADGEVLSTDTVVVEVWQADGDGDGVADREDNCTEVENADQTETDSDGYGNACDADYNNNGTVDSNDYNLLRGVYGLQVGDVGYDPDFDHNGDGIIGGPDFQIMMDLFGTPPGPSGIECAGQVPCPTWITDSDGDGVEDSEDNCTQAWNPDQCDTNGDGYGNRCDADVTDDGIVGGPDYVQLQIHYGTQPPTNPDLDLDCDGDVDAHDSNWLIGHWLEAPGPSGLSCAGSEQCPQD